jgi:hypothetical protein
LVLLPGFVEVASGFQRLSLSSMRVPGLFEKQKLVRNTRSPKPAKFVRGNAGSGGHSKLVFRAGAISFASPPASETADEEEEDDYDDGLPIAASILGFRG